MARFRRLRTRNTFVRERRYEHRAREQTRRHHTYDVILENFHMKLRYGESCGLGEALEGDDDRPRWSNTVARHGASGAAAMPAVTAIAILHRYN